MSTRIRRTVALSLAISASLLFIPWVGILQGAEPAGVHAGASTSQTITVDTAFAFTPNNFEVTPGSEVTLTLTQLDSVEHTFTLSSVANYTFGTTNTTSTDLTSFFSKHPPIVSVTFGTTPGWTTTVTFTAPPLGVYEFVCEIPGHFQAGMFGFMGSGVSVSGPAPPGVPVGLYIITGTIVGLVIIAIVLGFVVGQREGSKHEMPPERLGYAEPKTPADAPGRPPPPFA